MSVALSPVIVFLGYLSVERAVQEKLAELGYYYGPVDVTMGQETDSSVTVSPGTHPFGKTWDRNNASTREFVMAALLGRTFGEALLPARCFGGNTSAFARFFVRGVPCALLCTGKIAR
jgi:hypothetical protein